MHSGKPATGSFPRLTLRSAMRTAQRAIPTNFGVRVEVSGRFRPVANPQAFFCFWPSGGGSGGGTAAGVASGIIFKLLWILAVSRRLIA